MSPKGNCVLKNVHLGKNLLLRENVLINLKNQNVLQYIKLKNYLMLKQERREEDLVKIKRRVLKEKVHLKGEVLALDVIDKY